MVFSCHLKTKDHETNLISKEKTSKTYQSLIDTASFHREIEGKKVSIFTLKNKNGLEAVITNYGLRLISLSVPDKNGNFEDVVLGFSNLEGYLNANAPYYGAIIGRNANRINQGKLKILDKTYQLPLNNGENHLHGGAAGFHQKVWKVVDFNANKVVFSHFSPHLEEGYPGNLTLKVIYELTNENELKIFYEAETDQATIVNLSHHSFFNLKGEGRGTIDDHVVQIHADSFTPINEKSIPTGEIASVQNTPFDFRNPKKVTENLSQVHEQLMIAKGFDHNFVLNQKIKNANGLFLAAKVVEPISGRTLEVFTSQPGMQFYTASFLNGSDIGKFGKPYFARSGFCLETQHFPDAPNQPDFPSTLLLPNQKYEAVCVYKMGVE
jgi:aldose 1-epimerase